jgi:hypothetical protein
VKGIPRSKAKNAYDLLSEVARLILAEPKRYAQEFYLSHGMPNGKPNSAALAGYPACGTVGCVAGWVTTLKATTESPFLHTGQKAENILGLSTNQAGELFDASALYGVTDGDIPPPQTRAYAKLGAKHIRLFQRRYRAQLKAKAV